MCNLFIYLYIQLCSYVWGMELLEIDITMAYGIRNMLMSCYYEIAKLARCYTREAR